MAAASPVSQSRILIGLILGAVIGCALNYAIEEQMIPRAAIETLVKYTTRPIGDVFLNLLFLPIVPLVFASLALSVVKLGSGSHIRRVGTRTILYFVITTAIAAVIGLLAVNTIRPGEQLPVEERDRLMKYFSEDKDARKIVEKPAEFGIKTFVDIVPRNPLKAFAEKEMLAIIFVAFLVGIALHRVRPDHAKTMIELLETVNQIAEFVIRLAMALAPYGVFSLIFSTSALFGYKLLVALAAFVGTVLLGLSIQLLIVFPLLVWLLGGMRPMDFFRKVRVPMLTAFSTSSSSATLPTAMKCAEEELGVSPSVSGFVLPLSASMNHNGTALFEGVTALFLAQAFGVEVPFTQQLLVLLLCVLTATGMAGVPGGSLPLIGMVISTATSGKVSEGAILIVFGVDRFLDMCRTMVNVTGDLTTVVFVARAEKQGEAEPATTGPSADQPAS